MKRIFGKNIILSQELINGSKILLIVIFTLSIYSCIDRGKKSKIDAIISNGKKPYIVFDSVRYYAEHDSLIDSFEKNENSKDKADEFRETVHAWITNGAPKRFWELLYSKIPVSKLFIVIELGTQDGYYLCYTLFCSSDVFYTAISDSPEQDSIIIKEVTHQQLLNIFNVLSDSLEVFNINSTYFEGVFEGHITILFLNIEEEQISIVTNDDLNPSNKQLNNLFLFLYERVFKLPKY